MAATLQWPGREQAFALAHTLQPISRIQRRSDSRYLDCLNEHLRDNSHILVGDNLPILQQLLKTKTRFHFMYTDPPYNTGRNFTYSDNHSCIQAGECDGEDSWLSFVTPRFVLAHRLLRTDGVLFVSIDDHQAAALTVLLRDIFGRDNHIGTLKWRRKRKPSFLDRHLGNVMEYLLIFTKNHKQFPKLKGKPCEETTRPVLNASNPICGRILRQGTPAHCHDTDFSPGTLTNRTLSVEFPQGFQIRNGKVTQSVPMRGRFRVAQELLDRTLFVTKQKGLRRNVLPEEQGHQHASDDCRDLPTNEDAETELRSLFGERVFDYPKPAGLVRALLDMCQNQNPDETYLTLDFFAGSAPLAEATITWAQDNNQPAAFFLAQTPEPIQTNNNDPNQFGTIDEIAIARSQRAAASRLWQHPIEVIDFI